MTVNYVGWGLTDEPVWAAIAISIGWFVFLAVLTVIGLQLKK